MILFSEEELQKYIIKYNYKIENNNECSICLEKYNNGENIVLLKCKHEFHYHCILKWLLNSIKCPICKRNAK